ncbi:hypothetical protein Hypma_014307 [Hypsizygus marmoreus]|uniref:DUF6533 domain-containing protein n=1 Tax=Hypsizygus marmoreus TaxID=39966 RepID=A0A369JCF5_HYPMA|nr:hypothetical protein Hypma_014307 [Hypsizygus marmoreus]
MGWQFSSTWIVDSPSVRAGDLPVPPFTLLLRAANPPLAFETVNTAQEILIHNYFNVLAISVLLYDHLMTSGNEVDYIWRRPKTQSAYWFFFHRYLAFFGNTVEVILFFTTLSAQVRSSYPLICKQYSLFRQLLLVSTQGLVCVLLTLRIYALYGCSRRVLAFMVGSGAIMAGVSCWVLFGQKIVHAEQESGCHVGLSSDTAIRLAGAWEALFVYDSIIFTLMMAKTWRERHEFSFNRASVPIIYLIFRDGAVYFAVMALANLANIMTFYFSGPFMRGGLSTFASVISVTMMSRLMLNLHETADAGIHSTTLSAFTSSKMYQPIDLSALRSGDVNNPSTFQGQGFGLDGSARVTSISRGFYTSKMTFEI